ncbi:condensation domain-containing protein [Streptomyces sp. NPDC051639]|uniref:condensation domain-containing protein n=1 Tax=unclassified Streptomyces TaxID=2593676 RepID=UPI002E343F5F|nr:condensation domain-containing protein [Streptomyces sp. NBC_01717]
MQLDLMAKIGRHPEAAHFYDALFLFRVADGTDVIALRRALELLWRRHESLRLAYDPGSATLVELDDSEASIPPLEYRANLDEVRQFARDVRYGYPLPRAPLFRARLVADSTQTYLVLAIHHLIYDGWSLGVLWRDLKAIHEAAVGADGETIVEPAPRASPLAAGQYAAWASLGEEALSHWRRELQGYRPPLLAQSVSPNGPGPAAYEMRTDAFRLSEKAFHAAKGLAREARTSLFTALAATSTLALSRVTGDRDWLIGTDTANREASATREILGFLVSTRVVRLRVQEGAVSAVIAELSAGLKRSQPYAAIPFEKIAMECGHPALLKINQAHRIADTPEAMGLRELSIDEPAPRYWRRLLWAWQPSHKDVAYSLISQSDVVDEAVVRDIALEVERVLGVER